MTDDEIKALLDDYPNLGPDEFRYFAGDAVDAINTLRERLRIAERERDFFRESGQRLAESVEYWQGVAMDNAEKASESGWAADYWRDAARENERRDQW